MAGLGHEDPFPRPGPNGRCRFAQETFAGIRGNGREAPMDLYGGFWVKWFLSSSVPAVAARRVDRLELLEIELGNCLELVGQSRSFEVVRQVVEPGAVFVL